MKAGFHTFLFKIKHESNLKTHQQKSDLDTAAIFANAVCCREKVLSCEIVLITVQQDSKRQGTDAVKRVPVYISLHFPPCDSCHH